MVEGAHGVGAATHAGQHRVGQPALGLHELGLDFAGDDGLEIPDDGGKGMRPHDRPQHVVGVVDPAGPLPHGFADRVLEGGRPGVHRVDLGAQQPHAVDVEGLPLGVLPAHEDFTLHVHERRRRGGGHPVLSRAGLGDYPGLAHLFGQQGLPQYVVDLVGAGVIQVLPLQIDFRPAQILGHTVGVVEPGGPPGVVVQ